MTLALLEAAVDALHTYLKANIEAKVADLNIRYQNTTLPGAQLADIKKWYLGNMTINVPDYPAVIIAGAGWAPKVQRAVSLHVVNDISLIVLVGQDDIEVRFRHLCRYALGLIELCRAGEDSMGYHVNYLGKVTLTDTLETQPFIQGVIIPVTMEQIETF